MPTAYDCLHRAVIKKFGKWYRLEWASVMPETRDKIKHHALAEEHWQNIFLRNLSDLRIGASPDGSVFISGRLAGAAHEEHDRAENIGKLMQQDLTARFWVYSSYDFDDHFSLRGFQTKAEAIRYLKTERDDLFFSFWFRW